VRQVFIGLVVILLLSSLLILAWVARFMPGFLGEWFGVVSGLMTTPFLMESSLLFLGFVFVLGINHWRRLREGDECVYIERVDGPGSESLPEHERWAVFRDVPPAAEAPDLLSLAEGALEIGDPDGASEALAAMPAGQRARPEVLALRIRLARATGREALAQRLEAERDAQD